MRVRVDRGTGVVRVLEVAAAHDCGVILNRIGADGQVYGGVVMGIGQALSEGTQLDDDGRQRNAAPARLQARHRVRRAADRHRLDRDRHAERRPEGLEGRRRAAVRPDRRRGRERDREGDRRARAQAADDAGAGLGGGAVSVHGASAYAPQRRSSEALAALAAGARPVAGGTDLVVGARSGKAPLPESLVAIHRVAELRGVELLADGGLRLGALASHAEIAASDGRPRALHRARRRLRDRRLARDARPGHDRRQPDERLAGDGDRRPARLLRRDGDAAVAAPGSREVAVEDLWPAPAQTTAAAGRAARRGRRPRPGRRHRQRYLRLEYRRQMEIAVVGATAVVTLADGVVTDARVAMTALAPTIRRVPEAEAALVGTDGGADAIAAAAAAGAAAATPISDVRGSADYRRAMAAVIARPRDRDSARTRREGRTHEGRGDAHRQRRRLPGRPRARHEPARRRARRRSG